MPAMVGNQFVHPVDEQCKYKWIILLTLPINANFLSVKVIIEILQIFPYVKHYQIKMDVIKRFMSIGYAFIETLHENYLVCAVEMACLEALFKIREDVVHSDHKQDTMDGLSLSFYNLMSQVSSYIKVFYFFLFFSFFFKNLNNS